VFGVIKPVLRVACQTHPPLISGSEPTTPLRRKLPHPPPAEETARLLINRSWDVGTSCFVAWLDQRRGSPSATPSAALLRILQTPTAPSPCSENCSSSPRPLRRQQTLSNWGDSIREVLVSGCRIVFVFLRDQFPSPGSASLFQLVRDQAFPQLACRRLLKNRFFNPPPGPSRKPPSNLLESNDKLRPVRNRSPPTSLKILVYRPGPPSPSLLKIA